LELIVLTKTSSTILFTAKKSVFAAEMFAISIIISEYVKGKGKFHLSLYLYSTVYQIFMLFFSYIKINLLVAHNISAIANLIFSLIILIPHLQRESFLILPRKKWMRTISSSFHFIILTASHQFIAWSGTIFIGFMSTPSNVNTFQVFLRISGMYLFVANTTDQIFAKNLVKNQGDITNKVYFFYRYSCILSIFGTTTITGLIYTIHSTNMIHIEALNQIRNISLLYLLIFGLLISVTPTFTSYLVINKREDIFARNVLISCFALISIYITSSLVNSYFFQAATVGYMTAVLLYRSLNIISGIKISKND
tara:strand:+ start:7099 stop:8025 length:927 start_codon:yes stop_codon:yes gene_type:complete